MITTWVVEAPAKVNLALFVGRRRADGFHELRTVYQAIGLSDVVEVRLHGEGGRTTLEVVGAELGPEVQNLALRAAESFRSLTGADAGVHIRLTKRIPAGAGLGGGSSDAGAVLRCLATATGYDEPGALGSAAAALGSDVPFFVGPGALAIGTGRGEIVEPLGALPARPVVVVLPPVHVPTPRAYELLAASRAAAGPSSDPPLPSLATPTLGSWAELDRLSANDFEPVIASHHAEIARALEALRDAGASLAILSGSGAASFGFFPSAEAAREAGVELEAALGWPAVATTTLERLPEPQALPAPGP